MLKIDEAVVVEGKYDKIKLSNILDAFIIETNGFGIYKDKERLAFIRRMADERGIIILTDSDSAGCQIRNYISAGIDPQKIKNIYIPAICGKEKRKKAPSKSGLLGVEGISEKKLLELFSAAGINAAETRCGCQITNYDFYEAKISGRKNAAANRKKLLEALQLPEFLSSSSLLSYVNYHYTKKQFLQLVESLNFE
ncbi:MAG: DUF4093 domain-containing protein [Clostridiales bacterium]|nr:DUF4093 domain-containing protein [Clostridiales bacterium]